jgi:chromosome segregation ATPase
MDGAIKKIKTRVEELQGKLQNKNLKQRKAVEDELKHMLEQMTSAQHDIDENQGKAQSLLSRKTNLTNKMNAKKASLEKFKSGAL